MQVTPSKDVLTRQDRGGTSFPVDQTQARADDVQVLNRPAVGSQVVVVAPTRGLFEPLLCAHFMTWRCKRFFDQVVARGLVTAVADADTIAQLRACASWDVPKTSPENAKAKAEIQTVRIISKIPSFWVPH